MKLDGCRRLDRRYQIEGDVIHTTASQLSTRLSYHMFVTAPEGARCQVLWKEHS